MKRRTSRGRARGAPDVSRPLRQAAARLAKIPGVRGVFFGRGQRAGRWQSASRLVVHVARKVHALHLEDGMRLPRKVGACQVDVMEVGVPHVHALDVGDELVASGVTTRTGTLSVLLPASQGGLAVLSGHVGLPFREGRIVSDYDNQSDAASAVTVLDATTSRLFQGSLLRGGLSSSADWALALFSDAHGADIDAVHALASSPPPLQVRSTPLGSGEAVRQYSRLLQKIIKGKFVHKALTPIELRLDDGTMHAYSDLLVVAGDSPPFSRGGDSGSLVCDADKRVVGIILGGADNGSVSYVLPIDSLRFPLGDHFGTFFV